MRKGEESEGWGEIERGSKKKERGRREDEFCFKDTATTEIYTLSLHDALPIWWGLQRGGAPKQRPAFAVHEVGAAEGRSPEAAPSFCCA